MKLKVISGAREGVEVPLKKDKFVIGRATDCTLRASSDAISRHHCVLLRSEDGVVTARDLGSRNGTYVNETKIDRETPLVDGDELRVGPLHFLVVAPADLNRRKKPAVRSVAEAVERASAADKGVAGDDDISRWLLGPEESPPASMHETQSFRLDETQATPKHAREVGDGEPDADDPSDGDGLAGTETIAASSPAEETPPPDALDGDSADDEKSKKRGKKKPGKLPPLPTKPVAKDSREAAADILREMARRR